jgi:subtilisin family serine protease
MRRAGKLTGHGIWPVATAFATMLAIVAGLHSDATYARDDQNNPRKKAPIVRKVVPQKSKTATPKAGPKREGPSTAARMLGPAKNNETKTKEHDTERRKSAKTEPKSKSETKTREGKDKSKTREAKDKSKTREGKEQRKSLEAKANSKSPNTKSALTKAGPSALPRADRNARRAVNAATPQLRQVQRASHRNDILAARSRLPARPYPGERDFTGVPPTGETRFLTTEVMFNAGPNVTPQQIDAFARRHNCVAVWTTRSTLTGGTLIRFRLIGGQDPADMVRAMEAEQLGLAQPNYLYDVVQQPATQPASPDQYVADKLKLAEVHKIATGKGVLIAIIDSQIDARHPELGSAIAESFEAVGMPDKPHAHGTGMLGAIVSQGKLMGIAPGAKALAIHAFATGSKQSPQATTQAIIAGLEFALAKGARIINMSFAGPYDPVLQVALKKAAERGVILIAAVGNAGPKSPPLFPAADPHVIGVTATDQNDEPYSGANRGAYVAVAAPGVNIIAPAPEAAYQLTTGTSVAAAHVSGVAALLLERHPTADAATILEVLTASATKLTSDDRDDQVGWGLIDPAAALAELDARIADGAVATSNPAAAPAPAPTTIPAPAPSVTPASERRALPRPGVLAK